MRWINKLFGIPDYEKTLDDLEKEVEQEIELEEEKMWDEHKEELQGEEEGDILAAVVFTLDKDGHIDISTQWAEIEGAEKIFARLFWNIHNGGVKMDHLRFFDEYVKHNPESFPFLKKVTTEWGKLEKSDKPLIKPHNVLKIQMSGSAGNAEEYNE